MDANLKSDELNTSLPPCPHCGAIDVGFYRNVRAIGWGVQEFDGDGNHVDIQPTGPRGWDYTQSKKLYCGNCDKVRRDIKTIGDAADLDRVISK